MIVVYMEDAMGTTWQDQFGQLWVPIQVDHFAEQSSVDCSVCHNIGDDGWLCLDGGQELCPCHVMVTTEELVKKLHEEHRESMLHTNRMVGMFSELRKVFT
jgi:hypothetical protein